MKEKLKHWPLALVILAYVFLVLLQLENHLLWQDEAETALIGHTILTSGIPKGTDGVNYFTQQQGAEYGKDFVWRYHPWLQFYVIAPFLAVMGKTTLAARLPFALMGLLSLILMYLFSYRRYKHVIPATAGILFLISSDFFLSLSVQARYFSPTILFTIMLVFLYWWFPEQKRKMNWTYLIVLFLLFHTHYLSAVILMMVMLLHALLFKREIFLKLLLHSAGFALLHIPYLVWIFGAAKDIQLQEGGNMLGQFSGFLSYYLKGYLTYASHPVIGIAIVLVLLLGFLGKPARSALKGFSSSLGLYAIAVLLSILALSIISQEVYLRYMSFLLVFSAFFVVQCTDIIFRKKKYLALAAVIALPLLGQIKAYHERMQFAYTGPVANLVELFRQQAQPEDVIVMSYSDLSLAYYLPNRIISAHRPEDWSDIKDARFIVIRQNVNAEQELALYEYVSVLVDETYRLGTLSHAPDLPYECRETPEYDVREILPQMPPLQVFMKVE